jgi:UDP-N-acetylglucosamine diphosphorylase/glucosamine-1-phosphate N-acetyltransferase
VSAGFVLYDDAIARAAEPFALTRPFGELRAGASLIRDRWERLLGMPAASFIGAPHLATFDEFGAPPAATGSLAAGTVIVNSRFAPALDGRIPALTPGQSLRANGEIAAVALKSKLDTAKLADGGADLRSLDAPGTSKEVSGWWLGAAWDFVDTLPEMLAADASVLANHMPTQLPPQVSVLGAHRCAVARGAFIEPRVVIDTTGADVVILEGARIGAFARIAGPCVIGPYTLVAGGRYTTVSAGEHSRLCGEMSVVLVNGHSNKAHDGFVGHTAIGRWANLGAGTVTSNLKNTYGPIRVQDSRGEHETGMQFLGSLLGDHVKTAIATRLNTGTIIGAGANIFGDRAPAKYVPAFSWGDVAPFVQYERDKFLEVAAHVMRRREVAMTDGTRAALGAAWDCSQEAAGSRRTAAARNGKDSNGKKSRAKPATAGKRR